MPLIVAHPKHVPPSEHRGGPVRVFESPLSYIEQRQIGARGTDDGGEDGGELLPSRDPGLVRVLANCDGAHEVLLANGHATRGGVAEMVSPGARHLLGIRSWGVPIAETVYTASRVGGVVLGPLLDHVRAVVGLHACPGLYGETWGAVIPCRRCRGVAVVCTRPAMRDEEDGARASVFSKREEGFSRPLSEELDFFESSIPLLPVLLIFTALVRPLVRYRAVYR